MPSLRGDDNDTIRFSGRRKTIVIGDQAFELIAKIQRRCKMDRVKRPQHRRLETTRLLEHTRADLDENDRLQHRTRLEDSIRH